MVRESRKFVLSVIIDDLDNEWPGFHRRLCDNKSPQLSKIFFSILDDLSCILNGFSSFSHSQFSHFLFHVSCEFSESSDYYWYNCYIHIFWQVSRIYLVFCFSWYGISDCREWNGLQWSLRDRNSPGLSQNSGRSYFLYKFWDCSMYIKNNWYHHQLYVPEVFFFILFFFKWNCVLVNKFFLFMN